MSYIWLPDKPHMRRLELFQERIEALEWTLQGKPPRSDLRQVILSGLQELPDKERYTDEHERFLTLAIAVACRNGLTPLESRCYVAWKGHPARRPDLISRDPAIRKLLGHTKDQRASVWREYMRHDWEWLKHHVWRLASIFNRY